MCLNSIIRIVDLLEKIVGKAAKHEKIKKPKLATDKLSNQSQKSIKVNKYKNRISLCLISIIIKRR